MPINRYVYEYIIIFTFRILLGELLLNGEKENMKKYERKKPGQTTKNTYSIFPLI
jgi:hypothetical protein